MQDNSLCSRIERAKKRQVHRHRLATMKSSVDTSCPKSQLRGRRTNPKKAQLDEDRFAAIERENRKLLIHMSKIMLRQPEKKHTSHVKSLNLPQRQRDMKRINYENQLLLDRIKKTDPYCKSIFILMYIYFIYCCNIDLSFFNLKGNHHPLTFFLCVTLFR